jgi:hypothetical protein
VSYPPTDQLPRPVLHATSGTPSRWKRYGFAGSRLGVAVMGYHCRSQVKPVGEVGDASAGPAGARAAPACHLLPWLAQPACALVEHLSVVHLSTALRETCTSHACRSWLRSQSQ